MGRLILEGEPRKLRELNGSLYLLVEQAQAKIMKIDKDSEMRCAVYHSEKHDGMYLAAYPVDDGSK